MAAERALWAYHADDGTTYTVKIPTAWFAWNTGLARQWDQGVDPPLVYLPASIKMRQVYLQSADGLRRRNFPCSRQDGGSFPQIGATVVLPRIDGSTMTWHVVGCQAECNQPRKYRGGRRR